MMSRDQIVAAGIQKLAGMYDDAPTGRYPDQSAAPEPPASPGLLKTLAGGARSELRQAVLPTVYRPTMSADSYARSTMLGALAGLSAGAIIGALTRKRPLGMLATGGIAGTAAGFVRHMDVAGDPPGLSPIYTVPAGARLGALTGGITGLVVGNTLGAGSLRGAGVGAGAGMLAGIMASDLI